MTTPEQSDPGRPVIGRLIALPKIVDPRGNLTFVEAGRQIPFDIVRTYWIYDVPGGENRGGHAYRQLEELVVAISGSFDVALDDGRAESVTSLNRSYVGLYIPRMVWRRLENFSTNAVALIIASRAFDEGDYLRDHHEFEKLTRARL